MATALHDSMDDQQAGGATSLDLLTQIAQSTGDISELLGTQELTRIGFDVVRDYDLDVEARSEWERGAREGLKRAAQEKIEPGPDDPVFRRSYVNYPLLTVAAQQFNARAYPAICKSGSIVKIKVIGSDRGRPKMASDGQPATQPDPHAAPPDPAQPQQAPVMVPVWEVPPGAKQKRADRVADYLNVYLEYRMDDWEEDTDDLLNEIPIVGCGFRKVWWHDGKQRAAYVSALDLVVPIAARSLATTPRLTERLNDVFPFQIRERMNSGEYRRVLLPSGTDDDEEPRLLLEHHRLLDLDDDGVDEPYIVTVDHETSQVLRIVANFSPEEVHMTTDGTVARVDRLGYYVKYPFLPSFKGGFYNMGFGHLLEQLTDIVNTCINQTFDAGYAQVAGGGFVAAGLRLQGNNRDEALRWMPGEYKVVNATGADLRQGIVERTFPGPSQIIMKLLELMLGAAKDITSVKDVMTGEASNTAPVGTTLALIEQGLSVFTAIYKRVYRSLGQEFQLTFDNLGRYGDEGTAQDYTDVLDDPDADFAKDFGERDMDIKPVADPSSVTKMQQMAKAQLLDSMRGKGLNDIEINRRVLEAGGIDDIDALLPDGAPAPDPLALAKIYQTQTAGDLNRANAARAAAEATRTGVEVGHKLGESEAGGGGVPSLAGAADDAVGAGGADNAGGAATGGMGAGVVDTGSI